MKYWQKPAKYKVGDVVILIYRFGHPRDEVTIYAVVPRRWYHFDQYYCTGWSSDGTYDYVRQRKMVSKG